MTIRDEDVLPICNFCEASYDPYDRHTCAGNNIEPKIAALDISTLGSDRILCTTCGLSMDSATWSVHRCNHIGLSRQQVGEALDEGRREAWLDANKGFDATSTQVGGDHYRQMKIQPVEFIVANNVPFLAANIIKYASRYKNKGGSEDIHKIIHYCKLILEFEYGIK